jgi:hypothetical protein
MIVEFVRVTEGGFNWTPVWQTAIGTFGGFLLGLVGYWIQHLVARSREEKDKDEAAYDALKRLLSCATANIETLASHKRQFLNPLRPEVDKMEKLVDQAYQEPATVKELASQTLPNFYKTIPRAYEIPAPALSELSRVADEMPRLSTFVHRAMSAMEEYNAISSERNALIADHAKESAEGMKEGRHLYFASMLTGQAQGMVASADDALAFFMLANEQVESFFDYGIKLEKFTRFRLSEKAMKELPAKDRFVDYRKGLVEFDKSSGKRTKR